MKKNMDHLQQILGSKSVHTASVLKQLTNFPEINNELHKNDNIQSTVLHDSTLNDVFDNTKKSNIIENTSRKRSKLREALELRYSMANEGLMNIDNFSLYENLPIAREIKKNNDLISVPVHRLPYLSELTYKVMIKDLPFSLNVEENNELCSVLNPRYRNPYNVDLKNCVPEEFPLTFTVFGHEKTIMVNSYTGFVNNTTETIDSYFNSLKGIFHEQEVDLTSISNCVMRHNSDEMSKLFVISYVQQKILLLNLSTEVTEFLLSIFNRNLEEMNIPVIERQERSKRLEILVMHDRVRQELLQQEAENNLRLQVDMEISNFALLEDNQEKTYRKK